MLGSPALRLIGTRLLTAIPVLLGVSILTFVLLNLIPGTMVLELDRSKCVAFVHVLDIGSDEAVAKFYAVTRRVEGLLIDAFERPADRRRPDTTEVQS